MTLEAMAAARPAVSANPDVEQLRRLLFEEVEREVAKARKQGAATGQDAQASRRPMRRPASLSALSGAFGGLSWDQVSTPRRGERTPLSRLGETPRNFPLELTQTNSTTQAQYEEASQLSARRRARYSTSLADVGASSEAILTPSPRLREGARFHMPESPRKQGRMHFQTNQHQHQVDIFMRDECRYHGDPRRGRSSTPETQDRWRDTAGCLSARRRHDTPAGQLDALGRQRAPTPDYHRRYAGNLAGASVPGATPREGPLVASASAAGAAAAGAAAQATPTSVTTPRVIAWHGEPVFTASNRVTKVACRFYGTDEAPVATFKRRPQAFSLSSTNPTRL